MTDLIETARKFSLSGTPIKAERHGAGHINDTYKVSTDSGERYILQRINDNVFRDVDGLMENVKNVTSFILSRLRGTEDENYALRLMPALDGGSYVSEEDGCYRVYNFIDKGVSLQSAPTIREFELSALAFGRFQKLLDGYPASELNVTIPDFHNTRARFENLKASIKRDASGRAEGVKKEIEFYLGLERLCDRASDMLNSGELPLRVTHNDTKLNNVLIDVENDCAVTVIDVDTVMPGSVIYDFGDSIRFGASTAAEDERNLEKVGFSMDHFEAYSRGFIASCDTLSRSEIENLAYGAVLMTYETGMRFLTDHLDGDVYFKTSRPDHNLDRARTQMKLVVEMERRLPEMRAIIEKYAKIK